MKVGDVDGEEDEEGFSFLWAESPGGTVCIMKSRVLFPSH